jgi:hypothetical protein
LKQPSFLATKMDLAEIVDVPDACYVSVFMSYENGSLFFLDDAYVVLPHAVANLL